MLYEQKAWPISGNKGEAREMDAKQIVAQGYDHIAEYHSQWASRTRAEERQRYTALVFEQLPPGASVLELGCGVGLPTTLALAQRFQVTGIDLSARHIALAQRNVPNATFIQDDMTSSHSLRLALMLLSPFTRLSTFREQSILIFSAPLPHG